MRRTNLLNGNTKSCGSHEVRVPAKLREKNGETRPRFRDLTGQRFGKLTVTERAPTAGRRTCWWCQCDCGSAPKSVWAEALMAGKTISCGCHRAVEIGNRRRTHGKTGTRDYRIWQNMLRRCQDPNNPAYPRYGGRGIKVASEFQTFEGLLAYMGPSDGLTLDRIDNDGDYAPGNVRWASRTAQARNQRSNRQITFDGKTQPLSAWAEDLGISGSSLMGRIETGWPLADAMRLPKGSRIPRGEKKRSATKQAARVAMKIAIRAGRLIPQPCEVCGDRPVQGHHTDYTKPLKVQWLCRKHHAMAHRARTP